MASIDVTIVACRRPALLEQTLQSFGARLFKNFEIHGAFLNIDPMWGDKHAEEASVGVMKRQFPSAKIFTPEHAGFAAAVTRVWSHTAADFVFHLEDDWLLEEEITPAILERLNDPSIAQLSLMSKEKNWDRARRGDFHYVKRRVPLFGGVKWPIRTKVNAFTTSPSFLRGDFARTWAALMNENLDPEKQAYMGINKPLENFLTPFRNYIYSGKAREFVITDTGREWRDAQRIEKTIREGRAIWNQT